MRDLTEDLRIYPRAVDSVSGSPRGGCFHAGFLNRAQLFPLQVPVPYAFFSASGRYW
jgi:hypothetical protein